MVIQLDQRINYLEKKVSEQNDAIKELAMYMLDILEENDRLWKHLIKNISEKREKDIFSTKFENQDKLRFRSKTPPPLEEPAKFLIEFSNNRYGNSRRDSELERSYIRILRERRQKRNQVGLSGNKSFKSTCISKNYDEKTIVNN